MALSSIPNEDEKALTEALEALPQEFAPETLLPRILDAVQELETSPWWFLPFACWPRIAQIALIAIGFFVILAGVRATWQPAFAGISLSRISAAIGVIQLDSAWVAGFALTAIAAYLLLVGSLSMLLKLLGRHENC